MTQDDKIAVAARVPREIGQRLRWLAYMRETTVSVIVAGYIARGLSEEDFSRYQPPDQ